jgi:hypothetical protein
MNPQQVARPVRDLTELQQVLSPILDLVDPGVSGLTYRVVGTGAALAQGVQVPTGDIDILVARRAEVDRFAAALSGFLCRTQPVWLPESGQYFTKFVVNGIAVEPSTVETPAETDTFECIGDGPWKHYVLVKVGNHRVPVVRLELRLVSELVRDRPDRYVPLIEHMRSHGTDLQLVQKAMNDRGVDPAQQQKVLGQLQHH